MKLIINIIIVAEKGNSLKNNTYSYSSVIQSDKKNCINFNNMTPFLRSLCFTFQG